MFLRLIFAISILSLVACYRHYQEEIPNGDSIPHPCKPNFIWRGVGHLNALGGGARNPFGVDFAQQGHKWTKELCQMDSDGDGLTNGFELGDPECLWQVNAIATRSTGITHPGVCDPFGSPECEAVNSQIKCSTEEFICPAIHESHVLNITLRIPRTLVPAEETTYMCMSFHLEFPDPDKEYHLIATQAVIDNPNVMHHLAVTGCHGDTNVMEKPELCYMAQESCFNSIGLWTLGMSGECLYHEAGYQLGGKNGVKRVMFQYHWTNPERVTDYYDSSGMILYFTPKLRKYNAGAFITGQQKLHIPPGQARVEQKSTCSPHVTNAIIKEGIYLTTGLNHMHYLGYQQNVKLTRGDVSIDLTPDPVYSYDNPIVHKYDPPQLVLPGDELETVCTFRSLSRSRHTYWGEGTYDEMCYGIFTAFPVENLTSAACIQYGEIDMGLIGIEPIMNCHINQMFNGSDPEMARLTRLVLDNCKPHMCLPECPAVIAHVKENPCFQGEILELFTFSKIFERKHDSLHFITSLNSCDCPAGQSGSATSTTETPSSNNNNSGVSHPPAEGSLNVKGSLENGGTLVVDGVLNKPGSLHVEGSFSKDGQFHVSGTVNNGGLMAGLLPGASDREEVRTDEGRTVIGESHQIVGAENSGSHVVIFQTVLYMVVLVSMLVIL